jgi:phenylalanyl-tRNA synthetase beta chain
MNILIPDSWLREHLKTKATPKQIKDCLSLCGPSVERINQIGNEVVYDIEVTTNRVDMFSVLGIAREAAVILPEFGISAELVPTTYFNFQNNIPASVKPLDIKIVNDPKLSKRILAIKLGNATIGKSSDFIAKRLELSGQRSLNNAVDITNYVMWEVGHPIHVFDYDRLIHKTIIVREANKGESLITLDKKKHFLKGGEIVFDDGTGTIIDLPAIMGTDNTIVTENTRNLLLWIESADPVKIRQASMSHNIRTQAAIINEKQPDPDIAYRTFSRAVELYTKTMHCTVASKLFDKYEKKEIAKPVTLSQSQLTQYLGLAIDVNRASGILTRLGAKVEINSKNNEQIYTVTPPSWRIHDMSIPQDVIEEVARIYGYHNIAPVIPGAGLKPIRRDPVLDWEEKIKLRLRDFGFTEMMTYSMISENLLIKFGENPKKTYKISNPLSDDMVYLRPHLFLSMLEPIRQNLNLREDLKLFELSMAYKYRPNNLPDEIPSLIMIWGGNKFLEAKGMAEILFEIFGIKFPEYNPKNSSQSLAWYTPKSLALGDFGTVGEIKPELLAKADIKAPLTRLYLNFAKLVESTDPNKIYRPIPKYPPAIEDLAFVVPSDFQVGPFMQKLLRADSIISEVKLLDSFKDIRTFRVTYMNPTQNLTQENIAKIRTKLVKIAETEFNIRLKSL